MFILKGATGNHVQIDGNMFSYFGGNNYLGLANHPDVREAAISCIQKYGVNFSASRRTTGTADIHLELERQLSVFKGKEDAVIFASGYQGNSILLEVLKNRYSAVFMDQFAHPSIGGSIPHGHSDIQRYFHCDAVNLETLLDNHRGARPLIITDGIFALTGEIAPLDKLYHVAKKYNAILVVDDAHATGILGKNGRGTPEHFGLDGAENIYQSETMSKALGGYGGFISCSTRSAEQIRETSSIYQASTSLPPPLVAAGIASLKIIHDNPGMHIQLRQRAGELRNNISGMGFQTSDSDTPIIPIMLSTPARAKELSLFLEEHRIIAPFINYPANHDKHMIRIAVSFSHTTEQLGLLLEILTKWKDKHGTD
jgi:7-keto-8-aminopelargonate synthetase-like enzyme